MTQVQSAVAEGFSPGHFLTPGWGGDALPSKNLSRAIRLLDALTADVKQRLLTQEFNRSLKLEIYNEFLAYARDLSLHCSGFDELSGFWQGVRSTDESKSAELSTFLDLYCARVAVISIFKLRFIGVLASQARLEAGTKAILNPNHWLSQVFQTGTRRELKAKVMESNVFSWYQVGQELAPALSAWLEGTEAPRISELIKLTSPRVQPATEKVFSHALSHINFGLFLNSLLINLPLWIETHDPTATPKFLTPDELEIISCKFSGEYLESLGHSHWLAQENNKDMKWDQILCPDFKGPDFESGPFMKNLNELQFLSFLAEVAPLQGKDPIGFITQVMAGHFQNRKGTRNRHYAPGLLDMPFTSSSYDRVVVNLCQTPKNNPHHWILGRIDTEKERLKPGAYLYVLASKNLFIASQKDRLNQALETLELKAVFELEQLKGKGELGSWLYVFRRRSGDAPAVSQGESVAWFRFTGEMSSFQDFAGITETLRGFYVSHLGEMPALWQEEWGAGLRLDYFQDAIVGGHLIHSANEDVSKVTHPRFFKNLLATCVPMDSVYDLRPINPEEWNAGIPGWGVGQRRDSASFLMVDFRSPTQVRADLFPTDTFRSVYHEHGASFCRYFLVSPRLGGMNPNVLRKYFASAVGAQLLGLTFAGGPRSRGQLGKLLVPRWFAKGDFLPESLAPLLDMFHWDAQRLSDVHPDELLTSFRRFTQSANGIFPRYACDVLGALVNFEATLEGMLGRLSDPRMGLKLNFHNPLIQAPLATLESIPLLTHADVYTEMTATSEVESPLTSTELRSQVEGDLRTFFLEVFTGSGLCVRLHSEEEMLLLAQFVLESAKGIPVSRILRALRLPALPALKGIVGQNLHQKDALLSLLESVRSFMDESFRFSSLPENRS